VTDVGDRWKAIDAAVTMARREGRPADNTVVVLGKGHETGQEIDGVVHAFDDREALRAALDGLVYRPEASA
jgi:UDP-N-acetylmuramoyl-L-alanyl-D-glutamate--2,6-diaminopimelate ligase